MKEARFELILSELKATNQITYEALVQKLGVSEDTIRRDIDYLNKTGLLVKVRGGAISPAINPLSFEEREGVFNEGKNIIALKARRLLTNVRTVMMDGGTNMLALAAQIPQDAAFRVITNNTALLPILTKNPNLDITVLGGTYNRNTKTNVGQQTCLEALRYQADIYMMGICAIDAYLGITASVQEDGEVKMAMLKSSRKVVVLSNFEKLGTTDFFKVCDLNEIDTLITDLRTDDDRLNLFRSANLEIL